MGHRGSCFMSLSVLPMFSSKNFIVSGHTFRSLIHFIFVYGVRRRRNWYPTLVLSPGKSHGWRSLVGCSPWGPEESDTTERLHFDFSLSYIGGGNGNPLSSVLAWRIPGMEEPGGLPSMGSHRVRHDWSNLAAAKAWCYEVFWFHSFTCSCPIFPVPFIEEAVFAPWYILVSFVKNKVPIGAWVYSWASYLVPLVCFCASTTLSWWL